MRRADAPMENTQDTLSQYVGGFHRYILKEPFRVIEAGKSFCELTGFSADEIVSGERDMYAEHIHPADRKKYEQFLTRLSRREQTLSEDYRVICKNGTVKYLMDTTTSVKDDSGLVFGVSVLCDITSIKNENAELRFLSETVPCGFLKYTCEKTPKITYINDTMMKILRFPEQRDGEIDYRELYSENIYLMIPIDQRRKFAHFLEQVSLREIPISGEIPIIRCDGSKGVLYGWVTKAVNECGEEEFRSVCIDVTERQRLRKAGEIEKYAKVLSYVYDEIFEYDFEDMTVRYIHGESSDFFGGVRNVPMQLEQATKQWIENTVLAEDVEAVEGFFSSVRKGTYFSEGNKPPTVRFRTVASSGVVRENTGIFIKTDENISFFCCKAEKSEYETALLRNENISLKNINENMQKLVMRFTDGIMAFEISGDRVRPMYASDNICGFFGYTKEQWLQMTKSSVEISEFVSHSRISYGDVMNLLEFGEAEFEYRDVESGNLRRVMAVCSDNTENALETRYIMLYKLDYDKANETLSGRRVSIRTFGYFDVFVDGRPIAFRNKKSKELLALLVDRRGGYISSEEAIGFLWEEEPVNSVTLSRYRKVALRLKNILAEYGITDIVESVDGKRRIATDKVNCDLYDYLTGAPEFSALFKGSYLTNYSWAETTLGELMNK